MGLREIGTDYTFNTSMQSQSQKPWKKHISINHKFRLISFILNCYYFSMQGHDSYRFAHLVFYFEKVSSSKERLVSDSKPE